MSGARGAYPRSTPPAVMAKACRDMAAELRRDATRKPANLHMADGGRISCEELARRLEIQALAWDAGRGPPQ